MIIAVDFDGTCRRCTFGVCRKPAIEGSEYCREHKEYMEERQCQR